MEVGQGPNVGCSAKGKKMKIYILGFFEIGSKPTQMKVNPELQMRILSRV
jgi:hypothetical protein